MNFLFFCFVQPPITDFRPKVGKTQLKSIFNSFFYLVKPSYSNFRSLFVIVAKAKSRILSFENLRGIVRQANVGIGAKSVVTTSSDYVVEADSSSKIFQPTNLSFTFFTIAGNDRGYGHLAVCGSVHCRQATK